MIQTKHFLKIILTAGVLLGATSLWANPLATADSLFNARAYTQALPIYQQIYASGQQSPAMLLKMANIHERQAQVPEALYFLTQYHQQTGSGAAVAKMRELAGKHQLQGYTFGDEEYLRSVLSRYKFLIASSLLALNLLLLGILYFRKYRYNHQPTLSLLLQIALIAALAWAVNGNKKPSKCILLAKNNYLMRGPSPGADLVEIATAGHRLEILDREDVWLKVIWRDEIAYVKAQSLIEG